jgi:hypothetical protein
MHFKRLVVTLVVALALVLSVGSVSFVSETPSASAHGPDNPKPDNVWKGPFPNPKDGACGGGGPGVHDARGRTYLNECEAALKGVRVTWDGVGHPVPGKR